MKYNKLFSILLAGILMPLLGLQTFAQKSVDLKYDLNKGDSYHYVINTDQDIVFNANGQTMSMDNIMVFEVSSRVADANKDSINLEMTIDRVKMTQSIFGMQVNYDTDDPSTTQNPMSAQLAETFGSLIGKSFLQVMDVRGNVIRMDMSNLSGNDDFANNLSSGAQFGNYPDHAVSVGESWEKDITPLKGSDMKVHAKYTLEKVSGKQATIKFDGTLTANNVQDVDMKLNGTQKGEMIVDVKTGWLIESNIDQELNLDMDQGGQKFPATISGTIKTTSAKK
jgi:hypothetical protein